MNPYVSVIMPNYNAGKYIGTAIRSVRDQTYKDWELLIVDNASVDNSREEILHHHKFDNRIKCMFRNKNSGSPVIPRTQALHASRGKYIAFLDSDDMWEIDKLEKQIMFMDFSIEKPGLTYHNVRLFGKGAVNYPETWSMISRPYQGNCFTRLLKKNFIPGCSVMVKRKFLLEGLFQDESLKISHDWELWLRLARKTRFGYIPQLLGSLRLYDESEAANKKLRRKESREVVRRFYGTVPDSYYYQCLAYYYLVEIFDWLPKALKRRFRG